MPVAEVSFDTLFGSSRGMTRVAQSEKRPNELWTPAYDDNLGKTPEQGPALAAQQYYLQQIADGCYEEAMQAMQELPQEAKDIGGYGDWCWSYPHAREVFSAITKKSVDEHTRFLSKLIDSLYRDMGLDHAVKDAARSKRLLVDKLHESNRMRLDDAASNLLRNGQALTWAALDSIVSEMWETRFIELLKERVYRKNDDVLKHLGLPVVSCTPSEWAELLRMWLRCQNQRDSEQTFRSRLAEDPVMHSLRMALR
jgi:hypothetical protein